LLRESLARLIEGTHMNKPGNQLRGAAADVMLSYSDFIRLCHVDDPDDWDPRLRIAFDGVWLKEPAQTPHLDADLRADLSIHPDGDPSKPVITFPVSLGDVEVRLSDIYGGGFMDAMELADFVAGRLQEQIAQISRPPMKDGPLGRQRERSLLRMIRALEALADLEQRTATNDVCLKLQGLGFDSPKEDTVREILQAARKEID
jgi:hypothetical protein